MTSETERPRPSNLDRLREKVHEKADDMIRQMTEKTDDGQDPYEMDFNGREALADRIAKELAVMLLDENLLQDLWMQIVEEASSWECPRCGSDAPRHKDNDGNDAYEKTELKTKVGTLCMTLRQFHCGKCRKVFSPLPTED